MFTVALAAVIACDSTRTNGFTGLGGGGFPTPIFGPVLISGPKISRLSNANVWATLRRRRWTGGGGRWRNARRRRRRRRRLWRGWRRRRWRRIWGRAITTIIDDCCGINDNGRSFIFDNDRTAAAKTTTATTTGTSTTTTKIINGVSKIVMTPPLFVISGFGPTGGGGFTPPPPPPGPKSMSNGLLSTNPPSPLVISGLGLVMMKNHRDYHHPEEDTNIATGS